ncbi:putative secreted protein [Minicystis rosea]|nr:putative secreted protein [Minicystis rosea]
MRNFFSLASLLMAQALAGCSAAPTSPTTGAGGGSGASSGDLGGDGAGFLSDCSPACAPSQICSAAGFCIDAGACVADADCNAGLVCDIGSGACVPDEACGAMTTTAAQVPPNLLIVLDRSCSMTSKVDGKPKWTLAVNAINEMTTQFEGRIRFGLTLFPDLDGPSCHQGPIPIPVGPGNEATIHALLSSSLSKLDPYYPDGPCVTNIDSGIHQATTEPALQDPARQSYVLLLTDGMQTASCSENGSDTGTTTMIAGLHQSQNVATFVVGFGAEVDPTQLDVFADAGGVPSGDPEAHFYKAEDEASLETALAAIAAKTLSCSFALTDTPSDPGRIYVFLDDSHDPVPRDPTHASGWDYAAGTNQITFYGATCDTLKAGAVNGVHVVFGCGGSTG